MGSTVKGFYIFGSEFIELSALESTVAPYLTSVVGGLVC